MADLSTLSALLQASDWPRAERLLRKAAQAREAPAEVFYNLAKVLEAAGKPDQREVWLKRALARRSDYALAWFELGRVRLDHREVQAAADAFATAAHLDPKDRDAQRMAARLALRCGDWARAEQGFAGETDAEARLALYRIASERGTATSAERDALLAEPGLRAGMLKAMTRSARGVVPLSLPQLRRT